METIFLVCAVSGGSVLLLQFLAATLGFLGDSPESEVGAEDHSHAVGEDISDAHGQGHSSQHNMAMGWFAGLISFRSITTGLTFFGLSGLTALYFGSDPLVGLATAGFGGALALYVVAQIMKGIRQLKSDGTARIERTVGSEAIVYLTIPANNAGPGKVTIVVQKRTMEYAAFTQASKGLPTGSKVRVTAIRSPNAVEVEPMTT